MNNCVHRNAYFHGQCFLLVNKVNKHSQNQLCKKLLAHCQLTQNFNQNEYKELIYFKMHFNHKLDPGREGGGSKTQISAS